MINNKDMKKRFVQIVYVTLLFVVTAVLSLSMTSCDEGGIESQVNGNTTDKKVGITAQASYSVSASVAQVKFSVSSNTPWAIASDQSWCTATPVSSTVSALVQEITVEILQNPEMKPRTAVLTITGDGVEAQKVTIEQDARAELNVAMFETNDLVSSNGETRELTVFSNKPWRIICDKSWLTFDITEGEGSDDVYRIKATFEANTGSLRKALVTVKTNTVDSVYTVTQNGNLLEVANIADTIYNGSSQTKTYTISSNLDWKVSVDSKYDWVHITSPVTGSGDGEIKVSVDPRYVFSSEARVGYVKLSPVTPAAGIEDLYIPIHQNIGFISMGEAGTRVYNADGSVTCTTTGGQLRYMWQGRMTKGSIIWKFSEFDMKESGTFYIQADGRDLTPASGTNSNFIMWIGPKRHEMSNCGGDWGWQDVANFNVNGVDFSAINEIKVSVLDDPDHAGKLKFFVYINGNLIWQQAGKGNPFDDKGATGVAYYWGFNGGGAASFTVDSFTYIPAE